MTHKVLAVSFSNNDQPKATKVTLGDREVTGLDAIKPMTAIVAALVNKYIAQKRASSNEADKGLLDRIQSAKEFTVTADVPPDAENVKIHIKDGSNRWDIEVSLSKDNTDALKKALPAEAPQNSPAPTPPKQSVMRSRQDAPPTDPYFQIPNRIYTGPVRTPPAYGEHRTSWTPKPTQESPVTPPPSAPVSRFFLFAWVGSFFAWIGRGISSLFSSSEEELKLLPKQKHSFTDQKIIPSAASTTSSTFPAKTLLGVRGIRNEVNTCFINAVFQAVMNIPEMIPCLITAHEDKIRKETTEFEEKTLSITADEKEVSDLQMQIQNLKNNYYWYNHFLPDQEYSRLTAQMQISQKRIENCRAEQRSLQNSIKASTSLIAAIGAYNGKTKNPFEMKDLRGFDSSFGSYSQEDANDLLVKIFDPLLEPLRNGINAEGHRDISVIPANIDPAVRDSLGRFVPKFGEVKQLQLCDATEKRASARADIAVQNLSQLPEGGLKKSMVASSILPFAIPNEDAALQDLVTAQLIMQKPAEQDETSVYESNGVRGDYQVLEKKIVIESIGNAPEIISIQLKRFNPDGSKIDSAIALPAENRITLIIDEKNIAYEIQSLVLHRGYSARSGHYIACVRRNGTWIEADDSNVNELAQLPESVEKDVYMLVLKRVP